MSDGRFSEWQQARGWAVAPLVVTSVKWAADGLIVSLQDEPPARAWEDLRSLADELSRDWSVPVEFVCDDLGLENVVFQALAETQPALAAMISMDRIAVDGERVILTLPNPVAGSLFEKWGGVRRLMREVPLLAGRTVETATEESTPPQPDAPVPVALVAAGNASASARIGTKLPDAESALPLDQVPPGGPVVAAGQVIQRDIRESRDGSRHWTWTITDEVSALRIKYSERRNAPRLHDDLWAVGTEVLVEGVMEVDKFTEEVVLRIKHGAAVEGKPLFTPDSRPRVELHAHTKMSAMDGLIAPKDLFEAARDAGMTAVAVTDHGVVQSYPEADSLAKSTGVRALYGVEAYMVDTEVSPLTGPLNGNWSEKPLIVFDVETTGLSPRSHQVIELGAVKVIGGQIAETFHRLVRPARDISEATTRITGIAADMLQDGVSEEALWEDFFAFAGDGVLTAHNARFDMGFVRAGHQRFFSERPFDPVVLDTLTLARQVVSGVKGFGLGPLTQHFKIPLSQHHRALADAEATGHLAIKLLEELKAQFPDWTAGEPLPISHTVGRPTPVVLLVKDGEGLTALYRAISESHLSYFHRVPRIPRRLVEEGRGHWLIGSPFHDGEIADALFRQASDVERRSLAQFYDYWEIVPPSAAQTLAGESGLDGRQPLEAFLRDLVDWGRAAGKWVPAVSDAHYLRPARKVYRDILAATAKGDLHNASDQLYLRSGTEMEAELECLEPHDREWVIYEAPNTILNAVDELQPVPNGLFSPNLPEAETVVSTEPYRRAEELYGTPLPDAVKARIDKEVQSIVTHGFSSIYYIAHRLVLKSLDDGYLVGSRGSVGSSLVATLLRITEVNPLAPHYRCPQCRFSEFVADEAVGSGFDLPGRDCPTCGTSLVGDGQNIPFETFLGFEGDKVPDIDLNFSGEYQPEIHRYTEVLFGKGHVFRAGTIATIAEKTAFGLVKAWARETGRDPTPAEVDWLAKSITGVKRTTGQHPGGLMVVPQDDDIHRFSPVQHPADDRSSDVVTTHFDYHSIEGRLLKLDLLGHDDPTAIRMLEDLTGIPAQDVPFQDEQTMSLFSGVSALKVRPDEIGTTVGSLGIPEFGTRFVRQMLVDTRPKTFAELVRISGLSHGTEVWTNNAQDIIRQKIATLSQVIATRDDIMTYLLNRRIAPKSAFKISEAVRKGRGLAADMESLMREHGVPDWYIESCRHISYLFPKAHAAAYVMMGWRIAWFKVHHPLAYYATYFSVRAGDFDADSVLGGTKKVNQALAAIEDKGQEASAKERNLVTVLELAREMLARGFGFAPIDLERSHATRFLIEGDRLIIPFAALSGLGVNAAQHIIDARSQQPFLSIDDLRQRAKLSKSIIELLRNHGALKDLGETSQLGFF